MATRSLSLRVAWKQPSSRQPCAAGLAARAQQISLPSPADRDGNLANSAPSLKCSTPEQKLGRRGRPSVCSLSQAETVQYLRIGVHDFEVEEADRFPAAPETTGTRAALRGSFETQAAVGRVECTGKGCRPIFDEPSTASVSRDDWFSRENAFDVLESRTAAYHNRSRSRDAEIRPKPHFPLDFAEFLNEVWMENGAAEKYFEAALQADPRDPRLLSEYALFSWKSLGDADKAENLYKQALEQTPDSPDILASYALFLWQCDE
ncbi:hypothetical protein CY35_04G057300 [Sphagnum magellanicum]|jgi:tetratricopeptide (TPR) repeat protein|nr:hypothetical protein CY35_04G057300 [Sphagnum magellanicum]